MTPAEEALVRALAAGSGVPELVRQVEQVTLHVVMGRAAELEVFAGVFAGEGLPVSLPPAAGLSGPELG